MIIRGPLTYLFGYEKLKLLKFFLRNKNESFPINIIAEKTKIQPNELRKELKNAVKNGILEENKSDKSLEYKILSIEEITILESIIFKLSDTFFDDLASKINGLGPVTLCVVMGAFLQRTHDKVDLLLVVDNLNEKRFEFLLDAIESELGKEITYVILTKEEFEYRRNMFDKFVLSILEDLRNRILIDNTVDSEK